MLKHLLITLFDITFLFPFNPVGFPILIKLFTKYISAKYSHYNPYGRKNEIIHQREYEMSHQKTQYQR